MQPPPPDQKTKLAFISAGAALLAGAIIRLAARHLSIETMTGRPVYLEHIERREQAISQIALILMAMGAAMTVVAFHHWLRRDR